MPYINPDNPKNEKERLQIEFLDRIGAEVTSMLIERSKDAEKLDIDYTSALITPVIWHINGCLGMVQQTQGDLAMKSLAERIAMQVKLSAVAWLE